MITQRFRPVGWVASVAVAATMLYLISLQVATERGRLETIDKKISSTKREIRQLQTEMGTRASLRQLERWNGEVLALSAPGAGQFLNDERALSSVERGSVGGAPQRTAPMVAVAAIQNEPAPPPSIVEQIASVAATPPVIKLSKQDRAVQKAMAARTGSRIAMADPTLLDRGSLEKAARGETRAPTKARP